MAKTTDSYERDARRALVAELYLKQHSQYDIADIIAANPDFKTVTRQTITNDIAAIRKQWAENTVRNLDEDKERELARIDALEREYWRQYEASMDDKVISSQEAAQGKDGAKPIKVSKRTETRTGDPRYLAGIQWCIMQRCKILGIEAPTKTELTGKDGSALTIGIVGMDLKDL